MKRYRLHELFMPSTLMSRHFQAAIFFSLSVIGQYLSYTNISDSTSSLMRGVWRAASPLLHLSQHLSSHPLRLCTHPPTFSTSIFHLIISFIFSCTFFTPLPPSVFITPYITQSPLLLSATSGPLSSVRMSKAPDVLPEMF